MCSVNLSLRTYIHSEMMLVPYPTEEHEPLLERAAHT